MIAFGVGPFANEPFFQWHVRFKKLPLGIQTLIKLIACGVSAFCSLWIIGVFA
jgi:hypothetical protein